MLTKLKLLWDTHALWVRRGCCHRRCCHVRRWGNHLSQCRPTNTNSPTVHPHFCKIVRKLGARNLPICLWVATVMIKYAWLGLYAYLDQWDEPAPCEDRKEIGRYDRERGRSEWITPLWTILLWSACHENSLEMCRRGAVCLSYDTSYYGWETCRPMSHLTPWCEI